MRRRRPMYLTGRQKHNGIVGGARCSVTKELNAQQAVTIERCHSETLGGPSPFKSITNSTSDSRGPAGLGTVLEYKTHRGDGAPGLEKYVNDLNRMIGVVHAALVAMNKTLLQSSTKERTQGTYLIDGFESIVHPGFPKQTSIEGQLYCKLYSLGQGMGDRISGRFPAKHILSNFPWDL